MSGCGGFSEGDGGAEEGGGVQEGGRAAGEVGDTEGAERFNERRQTSVRDTWDVVLTHPDLDHIGGAASVLRALEVGHVFEPGAAVGRQPYLDVIRAIESGSTDWRAARIGRTMELDGVRFDFLWPLSETVDAARDANQISAVLRVSYGSFSMLLTGDAGAEVEAELIARNGDALRSRILKLGHHGSATSSSDEFIDATKPGAVIFTGVR